jgi:hypothetical protein
MGQAQSGNQWRANRAAAMLPAYTRAFGRPYIKVNKSYGAAIWYAHSLKNKSLYGMPVCFRKLMIVDDPRDANNLWVFLDLDISDAKYKSMMPISEKFIYDRSRNTLMVKGCCLNEVLVLAKFLTDVAVDNKSADDVIAGDLVKKTILLSRGNPGLRQEIYMQLCDNLVKNKSPKAESLVSAPWYAVNQPFASNNPYVIAAQEGTDRAYYEVLDQVWKDKKASDSELAFPRAPSGKVSLGNLVDLDQKKKVAERLINYSAYSGYYKPGTEVPYLANLEKKTLQ